MSGVIEKHERISNGKTLAPVQHGIRLALSLLVLLLTCSCTATTTLAPPVVETGEFNLFLQPFPQEADSISFSIDEMVARRVDGAEIPLTLRTSTFPSSRAAMGQIKLASVSLPPGRYLGLALQIGTASLSGEEGEVTLASPAKPLLVEFPFTMQKDQLKTLFLSLSADRLVTDGAFFTPNFSLWKPQRTLSTLKGFVSNRGDKTLTVFNKRSTEVVTTIRVGAEPKDLALDQRNGWLYVALAKENSIVVVDINSNEVLGQIRLFYGDEPTELELSETGSTLLALNSGTNSVSIIDTRSFSELARVKFDAAVDDILIGPDEQRAYIIHSVASVISELDLETLHVRTSQVFGDVLHKGAISTDGRTLYLTTDFSANLLVVDSDSLRTQETIFVGNGARFIKLDDATGLLYISKQNGEISVVDPRVLAAIDSFHLPSGPVQFMTIDSEENALLVILPKSRRLLKIDLISKRLLGMLDLGVDSHAVVVMLER